jgi:hypothetical protein
MIHDQQDVSPKVMWLEFGIGWHRPRAQHRFKFGVLSADVRRVRAHEERRPVLHDPIGEPFDAAVKRVEQDDAAQPRLGDAAAVQDREGGPEPTL